MNKNFNPNKYWLKVWARGLAILAAFILTVMVVFWLIALAGCTPSTSPEARFATDWEVGSARGMNDEQTYAHPGCLDDWTLVDREGEYDEWFHCTSATLAFVCIPYCNNGIIDVPGITFDMSLDCGYPYTYYGLPFCWGGEGKFTASTNGEGKAITSVTHTQQPFQAVGSILNLKFTMKKREDLGYRRGNAIFFQREGKYSSEYGGLLSHSGSRVCTYIGPTGYRMSKCDDSGVSSLSMKSQGEPVTLSSVLDDPNAPPQLPEPKPNVRQLALSTHEEFWLNTEPNLCPETGLELYASHWYITRRGEYDWYADSSVPYIYPISWDDEAERDEKVDNSYPYFCSLLVEVPEPVDANGIEISALCNQQPVKLYFIGSNDAGTNLVFRSDYIVACDNTSIAGEVDDDCGIRHVCVQVNEGESLKIKIPDSEKCKLFSGLWLTNSKISDINNSGTTNYLDTTYIFP